MKPLILLTLIMALLSFSVSAQEADEGLEINAEEVEILSDGLVYVSYLAAPAEEGQYPAVVLIHSFNGLEEGYRTMTDQFAAQGFCRPGCGLADS